MITKALDSNNGLRLVDARDAMPGRPYLCPNCGIKLHVSTSVCGNQYFKVYAHDEHKSAACRKIDREYSVIRSVKKLDKNKFVPKLMRIKNRSNSTNSVTYSKPGTEKYSEEERIGEFNSIEQFYGSGLDKMSPDTPIQDGAVLSDVFIGRYQYSNFFPWSTELGYRVLELVPIHAWNKYITFISYFQDCGIKKVHFFQLVVPDENLLPQVVSMLFKIEGEYSMNNNYNNRKNKVVAVASDWHDFSANTCRNVCRRCQDIHMDQCTGMTSGILQNIKQIYVPDFDTEWNKDKEV